MSTAQITTTPTPLAMVDKINEIITNYLPNDGTAESAKALEGLTATIAELNKLDGVTATTAELNYVDGVTSNIQTQLNGKLSTSGTAAKATADASGNNIANTYATKSTAITGLSASGKTVTYTKGDGTTGTITTQDTVYSLPTASSSTLGGIKVGSGLSISSGVLSASGSIVASSLGTNGYVKFGNGLILQWGYFDDGDQLSSAGNTRIFPLSMSKVYAISAIRLYSVRTDRHGLISLKSYTPSQAVFQGSVWDSGGGTSNNTAGTFFWFVVGKQQWGYATGTVASQTRYATVSFSIAHTDTNYVLLSFQDGSPGSDFNYFGSGNKTKSSVDIHYDGNSAILSGIYWTTIGL